MNAESSLHRLVLACVAGGLGVYQFDYRGQRGRNRGLFAVGGIEIPVGERSGLGLEIQLHAAHNNYEGAPAPRPC